MTSHASLRSSSPCGAWRRLKVSSVEKSQTRVPLKGSFTGLLSNQGENSINLYFIRVPLRKKY